MWTLPPSLVPDPDLVTPGCQDTVIEEATMSQEGQQDPLRTDTPPPDTPPAPEGEEEADGSTARDLEPCNGTKTEEEQQGEAEDGDTKNNRNTQSSAKEDEKVTLEEEGRNGEIEGSCLDPVTENSNRDIREGEDTQLLPPPSPEKDSTKPLCSLRLVK